MKVTYDVEADVLHIVLSEVFIEEDVEEKPGFLFQYDPWGNLVGLEIHDASKRVLEPRTLEHEVIEIGQKPDEPVVQAPARELDRIDEMFKDGRAIDRAMQEGVQEALWRHKCLGQSIVVWQDGKMVVIPPEEISVTGPPPPLPSKSVATPSTGAGTQED